MQLQIPSDAITVYADLWRDRELHRLGIRPGDSAFARQSQGHRRGHLGQLALVSARTLWLPHGDFTDALAGISLSS
jgi:hypothetical protein